jgi:hypothetical protein
MIKIEKDYKNLKKSPHLHSAAHSLADELSVKLRDKKHFAFYLKMAVLYNHDLLRKLAGEVLENKNAKNPGALFAYLIKKQNTANLEKEKPQESSN